MGLFSLYNQMAQQSITGPWPPYCDVSRSCGRTPWATDHLAARWPSHHPRQISNHSRSVHQSPLAIRPAATPDVFPLGTYLLRMRST
jgi:hypothetical protein